MNSLSLLRLALASTALTAVLRAQPAFDAYIPPAPKNIVQGIYSPASVPAVKIKSGQTVKIDTINSTELNQDDYKKLISSGGISLETPFIKETIAALGMPPSGELVARSGRVGRLLTGPVYIDGAEPGDILEVRVVDLAVQSDFAINRTITNMGHPLATIVQKPTARIYKLDRAKQKVLFNDRIEIPFWPYLGEMGVTPSEEMGSFIANRPSKVHGGSLDCPDLGKGASIYFPVHVPGAMFLTGGGKATGANGKVNYFGMEVPLTAYLQFVVHKGKTLAGVRAENATHYITFGTADVLDVVMRLSCLELVDFYKEKAGLDFFMAYSLGCLATDFNITRANTTGQLMHTTIPKYIFISDKTAYWYKGPLAAKYYLPGNYFDPKKPAFIKMDAL
ncbi:MAG: acetamidase/formamidase family protein [Verrucomicrobiota bacterium]